MSWLKYSISWLWRQLYEFKPFTFKIYSFYFVYTMSQLQINKFIIFWWNCSPSLQKKIGVENVLSLGTERNLFSFKNLLSFSLNHCLIFILQQESCQEKATGSKCLPVAPPCLCEWGSDRAKENYPSLGASFFFLESSAYHCLVIFTHTKRNRFQCNSYSLKCG